MTSNQTRPSGAKLDRPRKEIELHKAILVEKNQNEQIAILLFC